MNYGIEVINEKTKVHTRLDLDPMTLREAQTMVKKFAVYSWRRVLVCQLFN